MVEKWSKMVEKWSIMVEKRVKLAIKMVVAEIRSNLGHLGGKKRSGGSF
jgi:hypothetical protein